jgi:hypothetical protein
MHSMSNLNKFQDSYQVLEKNLKLCLQKKNSKVYKKCLSKFFWLKILTTNTLDINVHKMYECNQNQVFYYNVKNFKKQNLWEL